MAQPTILVKDANGANHTINTINTNGPARAVDSQSIVLAAEHLDAFARLRVSAPTLLLDLKRVGSTPDLLASNAVSGSGSATYTGNRASTALTVGGAAGTAVRQSKARAIYQPGKSLLVFQTFICAAAQANLNQRIGFFDTKNGVFFSREGTAINMVIRSFVSGVAVETKVAKADWNLDKLDGTDPSGIVLDLTKPQIFMADLEWLGVGRVRVGFVINGLPVYVHEFNHANTDGTSVYMSNPNLPVRWEIEATGAISGTATLEAICASVNSEGGYDITGVTSSCDNGTTAKTIAQGAFAEILAIRMQSGFTEFATAFIQALSAINNTTGAFRWRLVHNPTETGAGTWSNVLNSVLEKNTTRTVTEDTGTVISSGVVASQGNSIDTQTRPVLTLGTTLAGVTDVFSLQIRNLNNQSEDYFATLTWREIY